MATVVIFLLGIANFALHRAVLDSGHPALGRAALLPAPGRGFVTLATEFLVLVAALLVAARGWAGSAWLYGIYSLLNAVAAWLILTRRI